MDRETFAQRLHQAAVAARDFARRFILEPLPDEMVFRVRLNRSANYIQPHPDERLYPNDSVLNLTEKLARCAEAEVVDLLWREERVPEWVDVAVVAETGSATVVQLLCCGRFTSNELLLYHRTEGWPPFHVVSPVLPPDYPQGEQFSIYTRCEALNLADIEALKPHRDDVWLLTLLGSECNDAILNELPTFPAMQVLNLTYTFRIGSGLETLDRQPSLRVLNISIQPEQSIDLDRLPRLPSLDTLMVQHAPALDFDFGDRSPRLPKLNHLDLQCDGALKLHGRLPDSMWAVALTGQHLSGELACCKKVEHLCLHLTEATENEVAEFVRNTSDVKFLDLSNTPVSATLVTQLARRWPLEFLNVSRTRVIEEWARQLVQLYPRLRVAHDGGVAKGSRVAPPSLP